MVSKWVIRDRKGKSVMSWDNDVEASTLGDSHGFSEDCTRERDFDFSVLASRLEEEVVCMTSAASLEVWYIDSGASWHMTGIRGCFSEYREEKMNFQITMGNKAKCTLVGKGTIVFQTESGNGFVLQMCCMYQDWGWTYFPWRNYTARAMTSTSSKRRYTSNTRAEKRKCRSGSKVIGCIDYN